MTSSTWTVSKLFHPVQELTVATNGEVVRVRGPNVVPIEIRLIEDKLYDEEEPLISIEDIEPITVEPTRLIRED